MSAPLLSDSLDVRFRDFERRLAALERRPTAKVGAADVSSGTFGSGAFTFSGNLTVGGVLTGSKHLSVKDGAGTLVTLYTGGGGAVDIAGWLDFHRLTNADEATNYDTRIYSSAANRLSLITPSAADSATGGLLEVGNAYVGSHPVHGASAWAAFGHKSRVASDSYAYMHNSSGDTLINCGGAGSSLQRIRFFVSASTQICQMDTGAIRLYGSIPYYFETYGGGWYMSDTTWVRSYAGKNVYTAGDMRAGASEIGNSDAFGANYAAFGHLNHGLGTGYMAMQGTGGDVFFGHAAGTWTYFRDNNNSCFQYQRSGSFTDLRFVGGALPTLAGNTMTYATGSGQIGYTTSSARAKNVLGDLEVALLDDTGQPILNHSNPALLHFHPIRYHWKPEVVVNADDVNPRYPTGIAGFIAEEVHEVAPDAVTLDSEGRPAGLDTNAVLAYLTGALQHVHRGGHKRLDRLNALEGPGGRLEQIEKRIAALETRTTAIEKTKTVSKDLGRLL